MTRYYVSTALPTVLAANLGASGNPSVISLPGTWPASYPFCCLIDWGTSAQEAILVTSAPTGTGPYSLPCTRGVDNTTQQAHNAGAQFEHGTTGYEPALLQANAAAIATLTSQFPPPPGGTAEYLRADSTWDVPPGSGITLAGDLGGSDSSPEVVSTHLSSALPLAQGGTAATTASAARTSLGLGTAATQPFSAFANVFSPLTYGGVGNGTTDDTTPVQNCFAAAIAAGGGTIDFGNLTFLTSSPVNLKSNLTIKGAIPQGAPYIAGYGVLGGIINTTGDIFQITSGAANNVEFINCGLIASAGHIFNASGAACQYWSILNTTLVQKSASHCIWYQPNGGSVAAQAYTNMLVGDGCYLYASNGSSSLAPWTVISQSDLNSNTWRRLYADNGTSTAVPFFYLENVGTTPGTDLASDDVFEDITFEQCTGGLIQGVSVNSMMIRNAQGWDAGTWQGSLFSFSTASGGAACSDIVIINSGRRGNSLAGGVYDVEASSDTVGLTLINANPQPSAILGAAVLSVPQSVTIIPRLAVTATTYQNTGDGGTNGTAVTTSNSGGSSGRVFSAVAGTVAFDNSETIIGGSSGLSFKMTGSASAAYVDWIVPSTPVAPAPDQYFRAYVYFGTFPAVDPLYLLTSAGLDYTLVLNGSAPAWGVRAYPTSTVFGVTTPATGTWYRVELQVSQAGGTATGRIYTASGVLIEQVTCTGGTGTTSGTAYFGPQTAFTGSVWMANLGWSNTGWLGP